MPRNNSNNSGNRVTFAEEEHEEEDNNNNLKKPSSRFNNNQQQQNQSSLFCPNCGSTDIEQHEASGASICTDCGVVVEENAIVSSVEFVEGAGGASSMVGQFVSASSSKAYTSGGVRGGGRYGFSRDSRETTLANGRRKIQELASRLRLGIHYIDGAHRLFTIAVEKNFVQGRKRTHVIAACLYITCRQEKTQHMLIDFSDALQVNVYSLGTCFLKFRRMLGLKLEIIDPALYVYRFAAHLDLDEQANAVSLTALRLVARMKRDWIVMGRRPAGICAAALLIAARAHGFDKHYADVTRILKVCGMTVNNRIKEFEQTPSALLTLEQFKDVDFDEETDPPIYTKNKIREARAKAIQDGNIKLLTSGALDEYGKNGSKWRKTKINMSNRAIKFHQLYQNLEKNLNESNTNNDSNNDNNKDNDNNILQEDNNNNNNVEGNNNDESLQQDNDNNNNEEIDGNNEEIAGNNNEDDINNNNNDANDNPTAAVALESVELVVRQGTEIIKKKKIPAEWKDRYPKSNRGKNIILPEEATIEEQQPPIAPVEAKICLAEWKINLPQSIDFEIENDIFRTEEEEKQKEVIFNKMNKDYLELQERKENERLNQEAASKGLAIDDEEQAISHARYKDRSYKKRNRNGVGVDGTTTTEEQLRAAVSSRKVSRKINYDALSSIFDDDGSFATDGINNTTTNDNQQQEQQSEIDMFEGF